MFYEIISIVLQTKNMTNTMFNHFYPKTMRNFTFAFLAAVVCGTSANAQSLLSQRLSATPTPFVHQSHAGKAGTNSVGASTDGKRQAQTLFETFASNRVKSRAFSNAAQTPIWAPRHEVVYERSYKGGDWYLTEDITNYYDTTGRNYGFVGRTTDTSEAHPYYRQMTYYDEQGRRVKVTDEVSDDGVNFTPNWVYTYTYDPVVANFVIEEKCQMWNGTEYVDTLEGAGFKQTVIERDGQGRVLSATNYYKSIDYSEPDLRSRVTVTYADGQPHATAIKVEEQDWDYDTYDYALMEKQTYRDIVWAATDDQYINAESSFMQGEQRFASADLYRNGEKAGTVNAAYDEKNPEDYSYHLETASGKYDFKVWTVDENGSYRWENKTTYIENEYQGSGWDLDSTIVNYDSHLNMVLYERWQNSDIKVANGDSAELSEGEKYTIDYNPVYDLPDSVLFTGWRYVSDNPDNPWDATPRYVDLKITKYSDFVDASTGEATGIAQTTVRTDAATLQYTSAGLGLQAQGEMQYSVYDAAGRTIVCGMANGQTYIDASALAKGVNIVKVSTKQGTKSWKITK